jgi:hypothetical protein
MQIIQNFKKEIVISAYDKNLSWINDINDDVNIKIYRKGNKINENEIFINKNVGRDVHTFFFHIVENYDNLADITFFAQDYPFDHWGNIIDVLNNCDLLKTSSIQIGGYYGFHNNNLGTSWFLEKTNQFDSGVVLKCNANGSPQHIHENLNLNHYWNYFFNEPYPNVYEFIPGGHFCITKEQIRLRTKEFYLSIVNFLENDIIAPWIIERFELYIFNNKLKTKL